MNKQELNFAEFVKLKLNEDYKITHDLVTELKLNDKNIEKMVKIYSKIISRKFSSTFKKFGDMERYKKPDGAGIGIRMINDDGYQIRFNWSNKSKNKNVLDSIDFWDSRNFDLTKPTRTVSIEYYANILQVLNSVVEALKTGIIKDRVNEARSAGIKTDRTQDEREVWLASKGLPKSASRRAGHTRKVAYERGYGKEVDEFLGLPTASEVLTVDNNPQKESNSLEEVLKKADKELNKTVYANPDTVFEDIEDLLSLVANKQWRTLVVCGQGGINYKNNLLVA